jgi:hypothetical protein
MKSVTNMIRKNVSSIKKCNPLFLYTGLVIGYTVYDVVSGYDMKNLLPDILVGVVTSVFLTKLCKEKKHRMAYAVVAIYMGYWLVTRFVLDDADVVAVMNANMNANANAVKAMNAANAMNANMNAGNANANVNMNAGNANTMEQFRQCEATSPTVLKDCKGDFNEKAANGVGAFAGVSSKCGGGQGYCNMSEYYGKRGDWIQQQDLSMPDGPPVVAQNCYSDSPTFDRPCSALDTPATMLRNYPINTDSHAPHYRLCSENPMKVQLGYDRGARPYGMAPV